MKPIIMLTWGVLIASAAIGSFTMAHNLTTSGLDGHYPMHQTMHSGMFESSMMHSGQSGHGMMFGSSAMHGVDFNHPMFDLNQQTLTLNLNNEQVAILSQLEASHVVMQGIMQSQLQSEDEQVSHQQMMSLMTQNFQLMSDHHDLYQQFTDSLSEEQLASFETLNGPCH
ncbi:hypothetical protein [Reinekea sp. G2M2-21]|uniref:hypothetical protein n=1 Tax=Reinekea sp. G2M2-21 TaxID=2788942 RepID=UPI0018A8DD50|nr:hypothetical protein [Reinekea sp. G2M2-21]